MTVSFAVKSDHVTDGGKCVCVCVCVCVKYVLHSINIFSTVVDIFNA
jgi:hypothetical protein